MLDDDGDDDCDDDDGDDDNDDDDNDDDDDDDDDELVDGQSRTRSVELSKVLALPWQPHFSPQPISPHFSPPPPISNHHHQAIKPVELCGVTLN